MGEIHRPRPTRRRAAWCLHDTGDAWAARRARALLAGGVQQTAAVLEAAARAASLRGTKRKGIDEAVNYLTSKAEHLRYDTVLERGWPIATEIIEGACRHLVKDRLDITGARWGLFGAEAVLKLRAVRANGHFDNYWAWHEQQEFTRNHQARYHDRFVPAPIVSTLIGSASPYFTTGLRRTRHSTQPLAITKNTLTTAKQNASRACVIGLGSCLLMLYPQNPRASNANTSGINQPLSLM